MRIACLSGKGGAGKTLVAVNLAAAAEKAVYIDCDVEEPNGRLFFKPEHIRTETVSTLMPDFDADRCNGCRKCVEFCRFHALMYIREKPMVFAEVCHSCGGCALVCPQKAVKEKPKPVGLIECGMHGHVKVVTGVLNPGEASGVPVIREALKYDGETTIIDCPPGSACSVMECVMSADCCLLVAEPTAFGFHNFRMVHELAKLLGKECAVVINKQGDAYAPLEEYCLENHLPVLARIPYDRRIAQTAGRSRIIAEEDDHVRGMFKLLLDRIGGAR